MSAVTAPPMPTNSPSDPGPEIGRSRPQNTTKETAPPTTKNTAPSRSAIDSRDSALAAGCRSTREIDVDSATEHPVRSCGSLGDGRVSTTLPALGAGCP
jgi:hypothetical protein